MEKVLKKNNVHIEVTNLILEGKNDNIAEIQELAKWIKRKSWQRNTTAFKQSFPNV